MGNFSLVKRDEIQKSKPKWWDIIKIESFATVVACRFSNKANSHTFKVEMHTRQKLFLFGRYFSKAKLFCQKRFVRSPGLECSYGKLFSPVTETSVANSEVSVTGQPIFSYEHIENLTKTKVARWHLGNPASTVDRAHMKRPWVYQMIVLASTYLAGNLLSTEAMLFIYSNDLVGYSVYLLKQ